MPVSVELDTSALDALADQLRQADRQIDRELRGALSRSLELVRERVADYPDRTAANSPPGINGYSWYERGFGTRTVTGLGYDTSEELGRSWNIKIKRGFFGGDLRGVLGTGVSYAPYVHDERRQVGFHAARGWPTVQDAFRERADDIKQIFQRMINRIASKLGG